MDAAINPLVRAPAMAENAVAETPPFVVAHALEPSPVLFACPHSGRHYPCDLDAHLDVFSLRRLEDTDVDLLVAEGPQHGATVVSGCYGRAYLDLNRSPDDLDPAMFGEPTPRPFRTNARTAAGLGLFARYAAGGREIYNRKLSLAEARHRISRVHEPYHAALKFELDAAQARFGGAILMDWHSMPSLAAVQGSGANRRAVDVVLGDRHGQACRPELMAFAEIAFQSLGLTTSRNSPYAGGFTTEHHGKPFENRHALQIELNRGLYLDEARLTPNGNFAALRALVTEFTIRLSANIDTLIG